VTVLYQGRIRRQPKREIPTEERSLPPGSERLAENPLESEEVSSSEDQTRFVGSRISVDSLVAAAVLALSACASGDKQPPTPPATSESPSSAPATERVVGPLTRLTPRRSQP